MSQKQAEPGDQTRLKVLDCLRANGAMARKEIASKVGASPATITAITAQLLSAGLITEREIETAHSLRGRPRVNLQLNATAFVVAGVKVARRSISVVLCDFVGQELASLTVGLAGTRHPANSLAQHIYDAVGATCAQVHFDMTNLAGVAVGLAGQVDANRGHVHWSSSLVDGGRAIYDDLTRRLPCPAYIDNDANLVAKAEQLFGVGKGFRNFLVLTVEHGVGLGVVIGGTLYRGARGCGAEFGHTKVHVDGALCQCGQRGCLEAYVGEYALIREMSQSDGPAIAGGAAEIAQMARDGDTTARAVLNRAGQMFAIGVANLINIFDPECLILSGAQSGLGFLDSDEVHSRIEQNTTTADGTIPPIVVDDLGDNMWAKGAAALAIEKASVERMRMRKVENARA